MKVIFIINDLNTGGAEMQLFQVVKKMHIKHEIFVISLKSMGDLGQKIQSLGVRVEAVDFDKKYLFFFNFAKLCKLIGEYKPEVVHTWMYHSNFLAGIAAKIKRVNKIIWSIHHNDLSTKHNSIALLLIAKAGAYFSKIVPSHIICVSEKVKITHTTFGYQAKKMLVIPNGIDVDEFQHIQSARTQVLNSFHLSRNIFLVGFFCRYNSIKNHSGFLRAIALLRMQNDINNICVLMSGGKVDSENKELIDLIDSYDLRSCVHLLGIRTDMPFLMSGIDLFVNASFNESFSLVTTEALACNTLCVSSYEGDPSGIVDGIGLYFPANDTLKMKEAIRTMLLLSEDNKKEKQKIGRERVVNFYSLSTIVAKYDALYNM